MQFEMVCTRGFCLLSRTTPTQCHSHNCCGHQLPACSQTNNSSTCSVPASFPPALPLATKQAASTTILLPVFHQVSSLRVFQLPAASLSASLSSVSSQSAALFLASWFHSVTVVLFSVQKTLMSQITEPSVSPVPQGPYATQPTKLSADQQEIHLIQQASFVGFQLVIICGSTQL